MDYDGQRIRRLTTTSTINITPAWSPDGDELAFVSWRGRQPGVYVMSTEGELGAPDTVGGELSSAPDWSPDGRTLVYSADVDGNTEIYVLDRAGGRNTRLTHNPAIDTAPAYSPNGREIAFTSDRSGLAADLHHGRRGAQRAPRLLERQLQRLRRLVAQRRPPGLRLAHRRPLRDRRARPVHRPRDAADLGRGQQREPALVARTAATSSSPPTAAGTYDIYTMRADGADVRRLTRGGNCFTPDWSK